MRELHGTGAPWRGAAIIRGSLAESVYVPPGSHDVAIVGGQSSDGVETIALSGGVPRHPRILEVGP